MVPEETGGRRAPARQLTFDDLSLPLRLVTFVVFNLETTGGSAGNDAITEIGAVKVRGGEVLGTFATLVNPGAAIPPAITYLTGITEAMVRPAPTVDAVLPAFLEWVGGDAVLVGHNVRFDTSFVRAACDALGYDRPANQVVDTCSLARRLLREEVPSWPPWPTASASTTGPPTAPSTTLGPPSTCSTSCSSGSDAWAPPTSTTSSSCPRPPGTPRGRSFGGWRRSPAPPASTSSVTPVAGRCTSARPSTCAAGCASTSARTTGARCRSCCARRPASTTSCAPTSWRRRCSRSGSSTS